MKITILSVGQIKEKYFIDAIDEYEKRISKYAKVENITVKDSAISKADTDKEINIIKDEEGKRIIERIPEGAYKIVLDLKGKELDSVELSQKMSDVFLRNSSHIVFIIGGSLGLSNEVLSLADYHLCFSKMTFPHKLMKLILLEQVYRSFKIINNETYHK